MKNNNVIGIDLAKNIFQLHVMNSQGGCLKKMRLSRSKLLSTLAQQPASLIGIEACTGAHYWAREFTKLGHTVKMMAPQFVKPYVKSNKSDRNDAEAIAEAVTREHMRFVPIKTVEQQDMLLVHRSRQQSVKQRTSQANHIRGLLSEYGIVIPKGIGAVRKLASYLEENADKLTDKAEVLFKKLAEKFKFLDEEVSDYDKQINIEAKSEPMCKMLMEIEGVGPKTATAAVATIGDAHTFKKGRECSAWLGLVPKQSSSGNKIRLGGISKRGDCYLRTLLIHGARSVLRVCDSKTDKRSVWITDKKRRCGENKAAVALANKNARVIWALLTSGEVYRKPEQQEAA